MEEIVPSQSTDLTIRTDDSAAVVREQAIDLYIGGCKPVDICRRLGRSRTWFYETLARYRRAGRAGLRSQSRAAKRVHNRTAPEMEAAIERLRRTITSGSDPELRYANRGADALAYELQRAQITPPHRATINRILKRRDLIAPRRSPTDRCFRRCSQLWRHAAWRVPALICCWLLCAPSAAAWQPSCHMPTNWNSPGSRSPPWLVRLGRV